MINRELLSSIATVFLVVLGAAPALAEDPLVSDRPDFTESALAVGRGILQLEAGATYSDFDTVSETTLGELLVRFGVTENLELRIGSLTYLWLDEAAFDSSGFGDSTIGAKLELHDGSGSSFWGRTASAIIVTTTVPSASSVFESSTWEPSVVAALAWDLSESVALGTNLGWAHPEGVDGRFDSLFASVAVGFGLSESSSVFIELYGFDREQPGGPSTSVFQAGLAFLLSPDLQLDLRLARRLGNEGPDLVAGVGISWRLRGR